jgi:2,3-bisphosphoglycerate-independent phosphoglycerate mutase
VRLNLANGDMVGHTGDFAATVDALQVVDRCVAELEAAVIAAGGVMIVTADHGNADEMLMRDKKTGGFAVNAHGERVARTSHTLNPVPFCVVDPSGRWALTDTPDPGLANIGSTLLVLLGLTPPDDYVPALLEPA